MTLVDAAARGQRLSVCITAVANSNDINQMVPVRNAVDHAPLAHTHSPEIACAFELYNSG